MKEIEFRVWDILNKKMIYMDGNINFRTDSYGQLQFCNLKTNTIYVSWS